MDTNSRPGKEQNSCRPGPGSMVPVETNLTYTNAYQLISTKDNIKNDTKHKNNEKIKKDSIGIIKADEKKIKLKKEKIEKDSIGITKTHEKNIKSKKEKNEKDYIEITKTHKKNIKSIKCLKTKNCKKQSKKKTLRNLIEKKPKHLKPTKNITKLSKQFKKIKIKKKQK